MFNPNLNIKGKPLSKYKKVLIFTTGGGNDITSGILVAQYLQQFGIQTDISGMLAPFVNHYFDDSLEQTLNTINSNTKRQIVPWTNASNHKFVDPILPQLSKNYLKLKQIGAFYGLSTRFGTQNIIEELNQLAKENNYDIVVGLDMGGDILGRTQDKTILTPMLDFTSLHVLGKLDLPSILVEIGLLTDGELRKNSSAEILMELHQDKTLLDTGNIQFYDPEFQKYLEINTLASQTRLGWATKWFIDTLKNPEKTITAEPYFTTYRINKKIWTLDQNIVLPARYTGKTYIFDAKKLAQKRTQTAFEYQTQLEQFCKLKTLQPT